MKQRIIQISIIFFMLFSTPSFGHSGRTDSKGGHHDRINGGYHYHNGNSANQYSKSSLSNYNYKKKSSNNITWYIAGIVGFIILVTMLRSSKK